MTVPTVPTVHFCKSAYRAASAESLYILAWGHGPAHIVGGVELAFPASEPGHWWRNDALALAASLVDAVGGVVWDERGTVRIVVPEAWAFETHRKMASLGQAHGYVADANEARLVAAGAARWMPSFDGADQPTLVIRPVNVENLDLDVTALLLQPVEGHDAQMDVSVVLVEGVRLTFRAPRAWASQPFHVPPQGKVIDEIEPGNIGVRSEYIDDLEEVMRQIKHRGDAPLTEKLQVKVSPTQKDVVEARAAALGLTVADYVRSLLRRDALDHNLSWPEAPAFYESTP